MFNEGRALMVAGRFAEACPKLEESQRLEPKGGTQLNVAACHERLGKKGGFISGPSGFAGIAWNDSMQLGVRAFGGPRAGGGGLFVIGPSATAHLWGPLWLGGTLLFGAAGQSGNGTVTPESPYADPTGQDVRPAMSQSLGLGFGLSAEVSFALMDRPAGSLRLQILPLFLAGSNGSALSLPFGLAYRWN